MLSLKLRQQLLKSCHRAFALCASIICVVISAVNMSIRRAPLCLSNADILAQVPAGVLLGQHQAQPTPELVALPGNSPGDLIPEGVIKAAQAATHTSAAESAAQPEAAPKFAATSAHRSAVRKTGIPSRPAPSSSTAPIAGADTVAAVAPLQRKSRVSFAPADVVTFDAGVRSALWLSWL